MANRQRSAGSQGGFTIVELLIASAVFSVVLIGALAGFLQIGKMFYKGTSLATTQDTAKQVLNDVYESVQRASSVSKTPISEPYYYCVGSVRYTYKFGREVDTANSDTFSRDDRYALVKDILPGSSACAPPCLPAAATCSDGKTRWTSPVELLGDNMRLQAFSIQPSTSPALGMDYFTINVVIAFGDDDIFELASPGDMASIRCKGTSSENQHFCAVGRYSTSVKRGMDI